MTDQRTSRDLIKRTVDMLGATAGLIILAPVFIGLWLLIRFKLGSPVIFAQQRPGKNGKTFTLWKFRSMLEEDPVKGLVTDDQRMTRFGRKLRATSLDELPTLFNVLRGDMSLVGPRPLNLEYLPLYSRHQARRHEVRPGITGLAQVNGRNSLTWEERFELDVTYVDHHPLWLDLKILAETFTRVFAKTDIEGDHISTMTMFMGAAPRDGLIEASMTEEWHDLWNSWKSSESTLKVGDHIGTDPDATRHWVYLENADTPVGITGLSGLGSPQLYASLLVGPSNQSPQIVEALLKRLVYHGASYDAQQIFLRLSATNRFLHDIATHIGFVALDSCDSTPDLNQDEVLVAFATQTGP